MRLIARMPPARGFYPGGFAAFVGHDRLDALVGQVGVDAQAARGYAHSHQRVVPAA